MTWPMYFVARPCPALRLKVGDPFPQQSQGLIVGLGPLFGCPDAATKPMDALPYVSIVDVGSLEFEVRILRERLTEKAVLALLRADAAQAA